MRRKASISTKFLPTTFSPVEFGQEPSLDSDLEEVLSMKSFAIAFVAATFCAAGAAAPSSPPAEAASSEASLAGGTAINAALNTSGASQKAKSGEQITAPTTGGGETPDGQKVLQQGTKLLG